MPSSAGAPRPPTPQAVTRWTQNDPLGLGGRFNQGGKSRAATADAERRREIAANNPTWAVLGESPTSVAGAAQLMSENVDPALVYGQMISKDPTFETIAYDDETGVVETTVAAYFSGDSTSYLEDEGFYSGAGYTYSWNGEGVDANDPANTGLTSSVGKWPADLSVIPTSTINPSRPRTVAAGFDSSRKVLTTVFRDGTFYNYYGVSGLEWGNFKRARSKGRFIRLYLDGKIRGTADLSAIPQHHQELLYKTARTVQVMRGGYQPGQKVGSKRGSNYGSHNTAARSARKNAARAASVFRGGM